MRELSILLDGRHVADYVQDSRSRIRIVYTDEGMAEGGTPLSLSLPCELRSHSGKAVENFVAGLLPGSQAALNELARTRGVDVSDPFSILSSIGLDCPGAVQFCPPGLVDSIIAREGSLIPISEAEIESRLSMMEMDENAGWTLPEDHWSLGGTQQKFALRLEEGQWFIPQGAEPTTHIVKPGIRAIRGEALNEHVCLSVARRLGLEAADSEYGSFLSARALVVQRYDRRRESGRVVRTHQEDLCQALSNPQKYEVLGGPSAVEVVHLLRSRSASRAEADSNVTLFIRALAYNVVLANPDAHASNYSLLLHGGHVRFAPLYDIASAAPYRPNSSGYELAMRVGEHDRAEQVTLSDWLLLARQTRTESDFIVETLQDLAQRIPQLVEEVLDGTDDWDRSVSSLRERMVSGIRRRCSQTLDMLSNKTA